MAQKLLTRIIPYIFANKLQCFACVQSLPKNVSNRCHLKIRYHYRSILYRRAKTRFLTSRFWITWENSKRSIIFFEPAMNTKLPAVNIIRFFFLWSLTTSPFTNYCKHFRLSLSFFFAGNQSRAKENRIYKLCICFCYKCLLFLLIAFVETRHSVLHLAQGSADAGFGDKFNFVLSRKRIQMWWTRLLSWKLAKKLKEPKWN